MTEHSTITVPSSVLLSHQSTSILLNPFINVLPHPLHYIFYLWILRVKLLTSAVAIWQQSTEDLWPFLLSSSVLPFLSFYSFISFSSSAAYNVIISAGIFVRCVFKPECVLCFHLPSHAGGGPSNCRWELSLQVSSSLPIKVKPGKHRYLTMSPETLQCEPFDNRTKSTFSISSTWIVKASFT